MCVTSPCKDIHTQARSEDKSIVLVVSMCVTSSPTPQELLLALRAELGPTASSVSDANLLKFLR